jgi:type VI secretion system protein ImpF
MAELTTGERLQPSLLDRLTDYDPTNPKETRDQRVMTLQQIRQAVQRDLASLMNCCALSTTEDLSDYPHAERSVINFGIADLSGRFISGTDTGTLERLLQAAVATFEPRILPGTVRVRVTTSPDEVNNRAMVFEIEGKLWAQPMPLRLYWNTVVDLETGDVALTEGGA